MGQKGKVNYEFDAQNVVAVTVPNLDALQALSQNPNVELVEEDAKVYPTADNFPYGLGKIGATSTLDADKNGQLDSGAAAGAGRKVCVVDSGLESKHADFATGSVSGYGNWEFDGCDHGTHCAGTIAARANGHGVIGVAPLADLYIVKVFSGSTCGYSYSSSVANAANLCVAAGANIISMSLGGSSSSSTENSIYNSIWNSGVIIVAAAGNGGSTAFSYPASYTQVVSVAATDSNNNWVTFSQYNSAVDIAAPGSSVYSTIPYSSYGYKSGTSMACPHVSGALAAAWSKYPSATATQVRDCLYSTALDVGAAGRDDKYGWGIAQVPAMITCIGATQSTRGDGICSGGETCVNTPEDCPCQCGDGFCTDSDGGCAGCSQDCGACAVCGDNTCHANESCGTCPQDCGACCDASCSSCVSGQCFCAAGYQLVSNTCVPQPCSSCLTRGCSSSANCCFGLSCFQCGKGRSAYKICLDSNARLCTDCPAGSAVSGGSGNSAGLATAMAGCGLLFGAIASSVYHRRKASVLGKLEKAENDETLEQAMATSARSRALSAQDVEG